MATMTRMLSSVLLGVLAVGSVSGTYSGCRKPCTREYRPVCGDEGTTYSNQCLFENAKCGKPELEVRYAGRCGHPRDTSPKTTSAPPRPRPCRRSCPTASAPVCASNGKTYNTICDMQNDNCRNTGSYIYMVSPRPCAGSNTDASPSVDLMTSCRRACPFNYVPVCGSDGISYGNECAFDVAKCTAGGNLRIVHQGRCGSQTNYQSDKPKKSPVSKQPPCPRFCPYNYAPVCASNGKTYVNECAFKGVNCRVEGGTMTIVHHGRCTSKGYPYGKTPTKSPTRNCLRRCTKHYSPVCGSDGKTYGNQCVFDIARCQSQSSMKVLHNGPCNKTPTSCLRGCVANYDPVCGSDRKTYANKCTFGVANCKVGYKLSIVHEGKCPSLPKPPYKPYTPKTYTPKPYTPKPYTPKPYPTKSSPTSCRRPCPRHFDPVCGSDGRSYPNKCVFDVYNCKLGWSMYMVCKGPCPSKPWVPPTPTTPPFTTHPTTPAPTTPPFTTHPTTPTAGTTTTPATTTVATTAPPSTTVPTTTIWMSTVPISTVPTTTVRMSTVPTSTVPTTTVRMSTVPTSTVPTTTVPMSTVPTSTVPTTTVPMSTVPTSTVPTTTVPMSTVPTSTVPTTTVPMSTVPTSTVPTTTVPMSTVPTRTVPTTTVPMSTVPTSTVPTTTVPMSTVPTSTVLATTETTTPVPTTPVLTTPVPTTAVPTTPVPTTPVLTTPVPTTAVPTTPVPTTPVPTTPVPTTPVPTTPVPNTPAPTTQPSTHIPYTTPHPPVTTTPFSCLRDCLSIYAPICGSDGLTYDNVCFFTVANCLAGPDCTHFGKSYHCT